MKKALIRWLRSEAVDPEVRERNEEGAYQMAEE